MHVWGNEHPSSKSDFWESLKHEWQVICSLECEFRIPKSTDNVTDVFLGISVTFKILSNVILFAILCPYIYSAYGDLSQLPFIFMSPVFFIFWLNNYLDFES